MLIVLVLYVFVCMFMWLVWLLVSLACWCKVSCLGVLLVYCDLLVMFCWVVCGWWYLFVGVG